MATEIARLDAILGADISQFERAMKKADDSVVKFSNMSKQFEALKPFSPYIIQGAQAAKTLVQLKDLLAQLKIEQQAAFNPKELVAYNAAIKSVTAEVKRLESSKGGVSGVSKGLSSAFSSVKSMAYLLPGIGIAGIFDLAFTAISKAAGELGIFGKKTKEASEETKEFEKALAGMEEKIAQDLFSLQRLNQIATDTTNPYNIRLNAVKKLKDEYPQYLKDLSDEAILTGAAGEAIKEINKALLAKLTLQAGEEKIVKLLKQRLDLELKLNENQEKNLTTLQFAESLKDATGNMKALGVQMKKDVQVAIPLNKKYENSIRDIDAQVKALFQTLRGAINLSAPLDLIDPKETEKKLKEVKDFYADWKKEMMRLNTKGIILGSFQQEIDKLVGQQGKLTIRPSIEVAPNTDDLAKKVEAASETIRSTLEGSLEGLGESLGNLLSGQNNPFANIYNVIGEGLKTFGKQLIIVGKLAEIIQKALANLFGPQGGIAAIAAGFAAIALGTAIANLGGGIKQHAEGGIFTQPTQIGGHLFGEKEPEALIPLSRLGNMNGSGNNIQISGRLIADGNQLVAVINATNRQNSRTYGSNFNRSNGI